MSDTQIVLIADDMGSLLCQEHMDANIQVCTVSDKASALIFLQQHPQVSVLLIHLIKDRGNGYALLADVRSQEHWNSLSIGFCLDMGDTGGMTRALETGADELIFLPVSDPLFQLQIRRLLRMANYLGIVSEQKQQKQLHLMIDSLSTAVGLFEYANDQICSLYVNDAFLTEIRCLKEDYPFYAANVLSFFQPAEQQAVLDAIHAQCQDDVPIDLLVRANQRNRQPMMFRLRCLPISYPGHSGVVYLTSITNVTNRCQTERALQESKQKLNALMDAVPSGIAIFDLNEPVSMLSGNNTLRAICGYTNDEYLQIIQEDYHQLIDPRDREMVDHLIRSLQSNVQHKEGYFRIHAKDGSVRWIRISITPVGNGPICNAVFIDVTHDKDNESRSERMRNELLYRAQHDTLTDIPNRESFYQQTVSLLETHRDQSFVILMIDINRFKVINDMFGKEAGDNVLIGMACGLRHMFEQIGTYARLEADHFVACIPENQLNIEQIINHFETGLKRQKIDYRLQLSFGVYQVQSADVPVHHMCDCAAMALKTIKDNVVRRYAYYDEHLRQMLLEENAILDEMNSALCDGQFVPYLQPIYTVDGYQPVSAEVLVRWKHPLRGIIPPSRFIPLFERNGFITRLDLYMCEQACIILRQWQAESFPLPISVNISRIDLYSPHLCEQLVQLTRTYGIDPSMMRLEITESAYSKDPEELVSTINQLRAEGFLILMDDFGSGYSSLNILMEMPVDILKLDMRFLSKLEVNPRAASIITSVVRMAKWLEIPVIAEGVETWHQLSFLRSIGCDHVQGYIFAQPMDADAFHDRFLRDAKQAPKVVYPPVQNTVDLSVLWDINPQADMLFNGMLGAMGIFELAEGSLEIRRVNDGYYELFGCTPKQVFGDIGSKCFQLYPDDQDKMLDICARAAQTGRAERCVCRHIYSRDGHNMWLEVRVRYLGRAGDHDVLCFTFSDITEQKEFEQARTLSNYAMLLRGLYAFVCEINLTTKRTRTVYSMYPQIYNATGENPFEGLQAVLHEHLPSGDEELEQDVFSQGYLEAKVRESQSGYYQLERMLWMVDHQHWVSFTFLRIPSDSNEEIYMMCVADVDSRKRAEALMLENQWLQLRQKEQSRYQELMEHLGTSLLEWEIHSGMVTVSQGFERYGVSGFNFRLLRSYKDLEPYVFPGDLGIFRFMVNDLLAYNSASSTIRLLEQSGAAIWCRVLCSLIPDESGRISRCVVAINRIDEQVRIREDFIDQQSRFQAFADNFMVGLGIFEMEGEKQRISFLSDGYRKMVGYDRDEPFYDELDTYSGVYIEDVPRFLECTRIQLQTRQPFTIEYRVRHKNGQLLWMRSLNTIYPGAEPGKDRIFAVIEDITELMELRANAKKPLDQMPQA